MLVASKSSKNWKIIANVNQNQSQVIQLCESITHDRDS
jgi:hypothetical protein